MKRTCAVAVVALVSTLLPLGSAAHAGGRCNYRVYAPGFHDHAVVAKAPFSCTTAHRNSTATVVMQRFAHGKWAKVASTSKHLYVRAGEHYSVTAKWRPTVKCSGDQTALKMRTHFILKLNGSPFINYTTPGEKVYIPCS